MKRSSINSLFYFSVPHVRIEQSIRPKLFTTLYTSRGPILHSIAQIVKIRIILVDLVSILWLSLLVFFSPQFYCWISREISIIANFEEEKKLYLQRVLKWKKNCKYPLCRSDWWYQIIQFELCTKHRTIFQIGIAWEWGEF